MTVLEQSYYAASYTPLWKSNRNFFQWAFFMIYFSFLILILMYYITEVVNIHHARFHWFWSPVTPQWRFKKGYVAKNRCHVSLTNTVCMKDNETWAEQQWPKWRVVGMRDAGIKVSEIVQHLGIPKSTIYDILKRHRETPHDVTYRERRGRRLKATAREDRPLSRLELRMRRTSSRELRMHWRIQGRVCASTIRRRLNAMHFRVRRPAKKPFLTPRHRQVINKNEATYRNGL